LAGAIVDTAFLAVEAATHTFVLVSGYILVGGTLEALSSAFGEPFFAGCALGVAAAGRTRATAGQAHLED
jgi:hypothetical protein